jgi:hypothetical protein
VIRQGGDSHAIESKNPTGCRPNDPRPRSRTTEVTTPGSLPITANHAAASGSAGRRAKLRPANNSA